MLLYRGVNSSMFEIIKNNKYIQPKSHEFGVIFKHDGTIRYDGSVTLGISEQNAILGHQIDSDRFKTSGISTTPCFNMAKLYALHCGKFRQGYILLFNPNKLNGDVYDIFVVSERIKTPSVPEDNEIILKRKDNTNIPLEVVCAVIEVIQYS